MRRDSLRPRVVLTNPALARRRGLWLTALVAVCSCSTAPVVDADASAEAGQPPDAAAAIDVAALDHAMADSAPDQTSVDVASLPDTSADSGGCVAPQSLCAGRCTDTRGDLLHCGRCGNACPALANGTAACVAGACAIAACASGFHPVGGACVANGGVRPIAPMSLGETTLQRPTLRVALPVGADGAVIELCRDRACSMLIETLRITGTTARPTQQMPTAGVVFWRSRARVGAVEDSQFGPTWLFHVPAADNSARVDSSHSPHLDVDGDGFDDVIVGAPGADPGGRQDAGAIYLSLGSRSGASATLRTIEGPTSLERFGATVACAGDLNGDGFADVVVGAPQASVGGIVAAGSARVFYGSSTGLAATAALSLAGESANELASVSVATAGDINRDGYADLLVGAPGADPSGRLDAGVVRVHFGSATGVRGIATSTLAGALSRDGFGVSVSSAGDVNGDGFSDVVIGASAASPSGRGGAGEASAFLGSASGLSATPHRVFAGALVADALGNSVANGGDVNGDGYTDVLIGAERARTSEGELGSASVVLGSSTGLAAAASWTVYGQFDGDRFGHSVASAGDINRDGFSDVVIGAPGAATSAPAVRGAIRAYLGSAAGIATTAQREVLATTDAHNFGSVVCSAGDVNGDGFADILAGAIAGDPSGRMDAGSASVFHGTSTGITAVAARVFAGLAAGDALGASVASAFDPAAVGSRIIVFNHSWTGAEHASGLRRASIEACTLDTPHASLDHHSPRSLSSRSSTDARRRRRPTDPRQLTPRSTLRRRSAR